MYTSQVPLGPKGHFLVGNLPEINRDVLTFFTESARKYGDIFRFDLGPFPAMMINHPDLIGQVLVTQQPNFVKSNVYRRGLRFLGNGLLNSEGQFWQRQRRLVQPAFHLERIAAYADVMVSYTNQLVEQWQNGEVRDIHQDMMSLTEKIVSKTLFGFDIRNEVFGVQRALDAVMDFNNQLSNQYLLPSWIPTPSNFRYERATKQLNIIVYKIINERRESGKDIGDLLSLLLKVRDEDNGTGMTDRQVRDEVMTLFLAGHETTANAMTWTWFLLSQHPQVQAKLHSELKTVLGNRIPTFSDIHSLSYTQKVVMEAMRLYPPAWAISRVSLQNCVLGGHNIKAGTTVFISQWVMHRDSRFFENPSVFEPERWENNLQKKLPTFAYFPFGGGSRICIGKSFAMMEATLLLATIARLWSLTLQPDHPVVLQPSLTLRPKHGLKMQLSKIPVLAA
ncbi:cytochrome P450 [Nostoc sp. FACHB-888]|uniref:cytochrome P450 n=1 Tax=Nostoc sp. FACHB-888 TaxID=2692842 RepID=UPI001688AF5F|nr:cytochrome P450 [Nostoc sp. FACHB-888]MBD2248455.1 cytochrome P450 [Nostoc sp. FACHB-888]